MRYTLISKNIENLRKKFLENANLAVWQHMQLQLSIPKYFNKIDSLEIYLRVREMYFGVHGDETYLGFDGVDTDNQAEYRLMLKIGRKYDWSDNQSELKDILLEVREEDVHDEWAEVVLTEEQQQSIFNQFSGEILP